jgi:tight adherence protein B
VKAISDASVRVDVVALGQEAIANPPLEAMASEGGGNVIAAQDPEALTALFSEEAAALARQVLVTAALPDGFSAAEGSVAVSVDAAGETYSDSAFVSFGRVGEAAPRSPLPVGAPSILVSDEAFLIGLGALGVGGLIVLLGVTRRANRPLHQDGGDA